MAKVRTANRGNVGAARKEPLKSPRAAVPKAPRITPEAATQEASTARAGETEAIRFPTWVWLAVLALVPLAIFFPVLGFSFLTLDDTTLVSQNPWMHPVTWASYVHSWHYPLEDLYAPLTHNLYETLVLVSHALHPSQGNALSPSVFHAAGLILHIGCVWVVFALLRRLRFPSYAAFLGALLFAVHPFAAEPVCWIGGLDTVFSTFLCLLALWQYAIYAQDDTQGASRWWHLGAATICFLLALTAKPGAVSLPIMALVLELFLFRRSWRSFTLPLLAWIVAAFAWVHVTQSTQHVPEKIVTAYWQRPFIAGDAIAYYLVKFFAPLPSGIDLGRSPRLLFGHVWAYFTWLLPAAVVLIGWKIYRRFPSLAAGFWLMVAGMLTTLGSLPFVFQNVSTVADRYMYLAMVGPALVLAAVAARLRPPALYGIFAVLLVAGVACHIQVGFWRNSETFYFHCLKVNPHSPYVENLLGDIYLYRGNPALAATKYRAAAEDDPREGLYDYNLAIAYAESGQVPEAIAAYQRSIQLEPGYAKSYFGLGLVYAESGQLAPAAQEWQIAVQLAPDNPDYHYNLGLALLRLGRYKESVDQFRTVLALQPGSPTGQYRLQQALQAEQKASADHK